MTFPSMYMYIEIVSHDAVPSVSREQTPWKNHVIDEQARVRAVMRFLWLP